MKIGIGLQMKLRDYLEMKLKGDLTWPHLNFMGPGGKVLAATGEIEQSVLKKASLRKTIEYYTHLDIEVEFEGRTYSTAFMWDDHLLLSSLFEILGESIGNTIGDIGNKEILFEN
ncbi:MAG: hypothetical protein HY200_08510 [Nitrospirae bacterium]|nr:hypothetical protein [Nitrospirota bacterium]MBI3594986.1 hypothetical protein [Nitrospirota bacterium]